VSMISIQQLLNEEMDEIELEISALIDKKQEILAIWYQGYAWRV
jgi:hypothetical protein